MAFLVPDRVRQEHGLEIKEKIIPWGAKWPRDDPATGNKKGGQYKADRKLSGGTGRVQWITIHNTGDINEAPGTNDAEQYARAVWPNAAMKDVRVHYFIDETDCWQQLREDEVGWHAADGRGPGNETSLAIEIIMDGSGSADDKGAENRGALLAAILLHRHGLGIERLTTHNKWLGLPEGSIKYGARKNCPIYILPHWPEFVAKVKANLDAIAGGGSPAPDTPAADTLWRVQCGAFRDKGNADVLEAKLQAKGRNTYMVKSGGLYKVQVGAFADKANAAKLAEELKADGFEVFVTDQAGEAVSSGSSSAPAAKITERSKVRVRSGATTYTGGSLSSFVYSGVYDVIEIKGDRVVIGIGTAVTAAVKLADLTLA